MELYLKRYFWLVPVLVVMIAALLAARGTNHVIEGKFLLGETDKKPAAAKVKPKKVEPKPAPVNDGAPVLARNIFCSTCEPPKPEGETPAPGPVQVGDTPPMTSLPLTLVATTVASDSRYSLATIANTQTNRAGAYFAGEEIPGAGEIIEIRGKWVDFHNKASNREERIDLLGAAPAAPKPVAAAPAADAKPPANQGEADFIAEVDKGVKKIDDTHYEIDRDLVDKVLGDPNLVARSARIVPSVKDGKANGFKLYAIRPNSVYAKIGMQNGDTIHAVNGYEITSPDKALEVYTKVKSLNSLSLTVTRRGSPVTMEYSIK